MIALVGRAGPTIELLQSLEPGAAVEIITETGLDPLNPVVPCSLAALAVVYEAIVETTVAQRVVDARTEFVFALDIAAAMAKVLFGEIRELPFADKLEVTNTVFGVKADQTLHVVIGRATGRESHCCVRRSCSGRGRTGTQFAELQRYRRSRHSETPTAHGL